jgi:hypothetical protein
MLTCITRSINDELYNRMLSLCPDDWEFIRIKNSSATAYMDYIFRTKFENKWVLNLDEDCFLIDYRRIYGLIEFMEKQDFDYCGIQDGGGIPVRIHHPLVSNPFFNLFNVEKINKLDQNYYQKKYSPKEIAEKYKHFIRFNKSAFKYDFYEGFYSHFFWLLENGLKPFFNEAREFSRERYFVVAPLFRIVPYYNCPSLLFDHLGKEIALHTWHSRYMNYPNIRKAILNCYYYALEQSEQLNKKIINIDLAKAKL